MVGHSCISIGLRNSDYKNFFSEQYQSSNQTSVYFILPFKCFHTLWIIKVIKNTFTMATNMGNRVTKQQFIDNKTYPTNYISTLKRDHNAIEFYVKIDPTQRKMRKDTLVIEENEAPKLKYEIYMDEKFEKMRNDLESRANKQDKNIEDLKKTIENQNIQIKLFQNFGNPAAWTGDMIKDKLKEARENRTEMSPSEFTALQLLKKCRNMKCHQKPEKIEVEWMLHNIDSILASLNTVFTYPGHYRIQYNPEADGMGTEGIKLPRGYTLLPPRPDLFATGDTIVTIEEVKKQLRNLLEYNIQVLAQEEEGAGQS